MRLPGTGNSNSHGARPVHQIISMIKWIRTSRFLVKNSLSLQGDGGAEPHMLLRVFGRWGTPTLALHIRIQPE